MARNNGWTLYEHNQFSRQLAQLERNVEELKTISPDTYSASPDAKLLAAIVDLTQNIIPSDPNAKQFRQGATLGAKRKHWFRAVFGNGRYRLFYQFNSEAKIIIYALVNDKRDAPDVRLQDRCVRSFQDHAGERRSTGYLVESAESVAPPLAQPAPPKVGGRTRKKPTQ